jgi:hypothetical protein
VSWQAEDQETPLQTASAEIHVYHRRTERMSLRIVQGILAYALLLEILEPQFAYWGG